MILIFFIKHIVFDFPKFFAKVNVVLVWIFKSFDFIPKLIDFF